MVSELLLGGGVGAILAAMGMGYLLWRERDKRAKTQDALNQASLELATERGQAATLRRLMAQKEVDLHELEKRLARVAPGELFDDVFGGVRSEAGASDGGDDAGVRSKPPAKPAKS